MAKLTLKFDDRILKEYGVEEEVTIGRLPDNTIVIDNPAVSGHHARIYREGDRYAVEDLRSKNGTYVNQKHVILHTLEDGDVVLLGKHKLVFDAEATATVPGAERVVPTLGPTAYLDTRQHRELLARLRAERAAKAASTAGQAVASSSAAPAPVLRVLVGTTTQSEYRVEGRTSLIGKSENALVRLRGLFKPQAAAAIVQDSRGYALHPVGAHLRLNGERVLEPAQLKNGDVIEVAGLVLEFQHADVAGHEVHPRPHVA